ncbi:hypothetical protein ACTJI2_13710 [Pseudoxanthomonas sp. 22568]|uniref:hypothetical protein n=1 Tax=Pseudoxanthomonas sp. 22568 TaxID=3453945 RepID=UPI003F8619D6
MSRNRTNAASRAPAAPQAKDNQGATQATASQPPADAADNTNTNASEGSAELGGGQGMQAAAAEANAGATNTTASDAADAEKDAGGGTNAEGGQGAQEALGGGTATESRNPFDDAKRPPNLGERPIFDVVTPFKYQGVVMKPGMNIIGNPDALEALTPYLREGVIKPVEFREFDVSPFDPASGTFIE